MAVWLPANRENPPSPFNKGWGDLNAFSSERQHFLQYGFFDQVAENIAIKMILSECFLGMSE